MASTASRFDPQAPDKSSAGPDTYGTERTGTYKEKASLPVDENGYEIDLLALAGRAEQISKDYQTRTVERSLSRSYRAWRNEHAEGSKYLDRAAWRGRSSLFVPKTRSAVRKNLATAASALFSTEDVVNVSASLDDDPMQQATAKVMKADLDYRLTRGVSAKHAMPWFQLSLGACQDSQITGVTISKQYWQYEEIPTKKLVKKPLMDEETGLPVFDAMTGEPVTYDEEVPDVLVTADRPMIDLIPIDRVYVDPAAPWYDPAQLGRWFCVKYPMGISDIRALLRSGAKNGVDSAWLEVDDSTLLMGRVEDDRSATRRAREGGSDRYEDGRGVNDLDIVWLQENFLRISGIDYHWWSVGRHAYISKVRTTREAYPHLDGERPYVMGVAQIDTHRVFPMSPVESWQPLQLELNDITNLRQDTLKRSIAPLTLIKRGKNVDVTAVKRRGQPDAMVFVDDVEADIKFQQTPGPAGAAYTEVSGINAQFDELAGVFSTSSVQTSRQLNETVGGMRLMSGAANAVSEFDLRTWVETWVERVLRQLIHLIKTYESDEKILAIAGAKSRAYQEHKYLPTLADFDHCDVTLSVNVGIGALDPMQQLAKLKVGLEMLAPAFPAMQAQGIKPKYEVFIEEVMGKVGYKDGRRFFEFGKPPEQQQDPEVVKLMEEMKLENRKLDVTIQEAMLEMRAEDERNRRDNDTKLQIEDQRLKGKVLDKLVDVQHDRDQREHDTERDEARMDHDVMKGDESFAREKETRQEERGHAREDSARSGRQKIAEILAKRAGDGKGGNGAKPAAKPKSGTGEKAANSAAERSSDNDAFGQILERLEAMAGDHSSVQRTVDSLGRSVAAIATQLSSLKQRRSEAPLPSPSEAPLRPRAPNGSGP